MVLHLPILQEDFPFFIQSLGGDGTAEVPRECVLILFVLPFAGGMCFIA